LLRKSSKPWITMGPNRFPVLSTMTASPADQTNKVNQLNNRSGKRLISWLIINKETGTCNETKIIELNMMGTDPSGLQSLKLFNNNPLIHVSSAKPTSRK